MPAPLTTTAAAYDRTTIRLHWLSALLVAAIWILGQTADLIPDGLANTAVWSCHIMLGVLLAMALVNRLLHRAFSGRRLPPANEGVMRLVTTGVHRALYALLIVLIGLGVANAFVRGSELFGLFAPLQLGGKETGESLSDWHGLFANATIALAGLHAAAGLFHHYVWRDNILARMIPSVQLRKS